MLSALHLSGRLHDFWMGISVPNGLSGESTSEGSVESPTCEGRGECSSRFYTCLMFWFTMSLFIVGLVCVTSNTGLGNSRCQLAQRFAANRRQTHDFQPPASPAWACSFIVPCFPTYDDLLSPVKRKARVSNRSLF
jgi:hypothetical protein